MRITRSFAFHTKYLSKRIITISILTIATIAGLSSLTLVFQPTKQASAITPPDSCFAFNSATGTITNYYNNENNDSSQSACPKDVDIPSQIGGVNVTVIGSGSLYVKQLTSVTIPNTVTVIGDSAFHRNQLSTITIPSSVTTIEDYAFSSNKLTTVNIPSSVTSLGRKAFVMQNSYGGDIDDCMSGAPCMWSSDPAEVQQAYDSIWYTKLYTNDPSNPNSLLDGVFIEGEYIYSDNNDNGHTNDSLGGHLINPASLDLHYVNQANADLQTTQTFTGHLLDGAYLHNYYASIGPVLPAPAVDWNPTPAEQQAMIDALSVYYRLGDTVTITPPTIDGYNTPPTKTFVLGSSTNSENYVYTQSADSSAGQADEGGNDQLAETGLNIWAVVSLAGVLSSAGAIVLVRSKNIR